ncbi:MAG: hypothetical protein ACM3KR_02835 [Deltaproteobacteria bacterium]
MIIDIKKIRREIIWPIALQSLSTGIFVSVLISKTIPTMNSSARIIIERILGIASTYNISTFCEIFIKVFLFTFIQFVVLSFLFQIFAELLCKKEVLFFDSALIVSKPAPISALLLACGLPWLLITPAATAPYIFASFIITLLYNYTATCTTFTINANTGILLTASVYLIYFAFICICIMNC